MAEATYLRIAMFVSGPGAREKELDPCEIKCKELRLSFDQSSSAAGIRLMFDKIIVPPTMFRAKFEKTKFTSIFFNQLTYHPQGYLDGGDGLSFELYFSLKPVQKNIVYKSALKMKGMAFKVSQDESYHYLEITPTEKSVKGCEITTGQ
jgi:hypothetical protein